ncbi:MAG TPA: NAD(P)-dependent oxidoreductase, partial [Afifellaceae bacterium]|nr:NAD(P)-dependent oxidoreductase [Afifellaceae bacterium]
MTDTVGIIGLGLVGMAAAERLLAGGMAVIGHDPVSERSGLLAQIGGEPADVTRIWRDADPVIAAVFDTDQVAGVIEQAPENASKRLVVLSTCDPDRMAGLGARAKAKGITFVEAPLSGTSQQLANGQAVFLVGGDAAVVAGITRIFAVLAGADHHVGKIGDATRTKLAINLILGLNRAALAEGLVFAERIGLAPEKVLELARGSAAASQVMDIKGPLMVARDFAPQGRISQSAKDFNLIRDAALARGQRLPFAELYLAMMRDCMDHGEADLDNAAIIKALARARSGST